MDEDRPKYIDLSDLERAFALSCREYLNFKTAFLGKYSDLPQDMDAVKGDLEKALLEGSRFSSTRAEVTGANMDGLYAEMIEQIALFNRADSLYQLGQEFFDGQGVFGEPKVRIFLESQRARIQSAKEVIVKDVSLWADLVKGIIKS